MLLNVKDLKTYFGTPDNPIRAVDGVSFRVDRGETFCLVGESGSGKSMTSLSIMQLVPQPAGFHPAGAIEFEYSDSDHTRTVDLMQLSEVSRGRIRGSRIAMIFQEPMTSLNPVFTVGSQVAEPIRRHLRLGRREARRRAIEALDQVLIPQPERCYHQYPHELSGGMRQRAMIAMAMGCEPDLLIADEPTTALDVTTQAQILVLMKDLQKRRGTAILFITHDFGVVSQMADRVAVMREGRIMEIGERRQVLFDPKHEYTQHLIASLPENLETISGHTPDDQTEKDKDKDKIAAETPEPLLRLEQLKVHYPIRKGILRRVVDRNKAVDGVDLSIAAGSIMALVGESGCGKTTLGRAVVQLVQPTEGNIWFDGQPIITKGFKKQWRRDLQIIFQDPYSSLNPRMMIGDAIAEGMMALGVCRRADREERVRAVLEEVQLDPEMVTRYPHEFSGGQRQRIGIARCLAVEPRFIVCDEITSSLDVSVQASILKLLLRLRERRGLTLLFVTHNMQVVEYLADEVAVMYKGKIVESGPTSSVCQNPQHEYTKRLLAAVPRMQDDDRPEEA